MDGVCDQVEWTKYLPVPYEIRRFRIRRAVTITGFVATTNCSSGTNLPSGAYGELGIGVGNCRWFYPFTYKNRLVFDKPLELCPGDILEMYSTIPAAFQFHGQFPFARRVPAERGWDPPLEEITFDVPPPAPPKPEPEGIPQKYSTGDQSFIDLRFENQLSRLSGRYFRVARDMAISQFGCVVSAVPEVLSMIRIMEDNKSYLRDTKQFPAVVPFVTASDWFHGSEYGRPLLKRPICVKAGQVLHVGVSRPLKEALAVVRLIGDFTAHESPLREIWIDHDGSNYSDWGTGKPLSKITTFATPLKTNVKRVKIVVRPSDTVGSIAAYVRGALVKSCVLCPSGPRQTIYVNLPDGDVADLKIVTTGKVEYWVEYDVG